MRKIFRDCIAKCVRMWYTKNMNWEEIWKNIVDFFSANSWNILMFMAVLVGGVVIIRALCFALKKILLGGKMEKTIVGFSVTIFRFVLYIVLIFVLAGIIGIDMTPLATAISAGLVAIGLALQSSLSNLANGMILVSTKPFVEGDFIDVGGVLGTVKNVGLFVTELLSPDNKKIVMTNSQVLSSTITNFSAKATRRVDFMFQAAMTSDVSKVKASISKVIKKHKLVLEDPAPVVRLHEIKDGRLSFVTRVWANKDDYWDVYWDLTEGIFAQLKKDGIEIPFDQIDVHVKREDEK